jgi:hypothetical protein
MYLPISEACNAPNGLQVPTADLAAASAALASDSAAMESADAAFQSTLTRAPSDFWGVAPMVAADVAAVNAETGGGRGGRGDINLNAGAGGSCGGPSGGGCDVVPLNGTSSLPLTNAQPAPLRTAPILPGLGRFSARRRGGLGQCCTDLPAWGDAFPLGGPALSPGQSILDWLQANPLLAIGLTLAGVWIATEQKGGKRG